VIACFGTVDILKMEYENHDVKRVVDEISRGVAELKKVCDELKMKLVYVTPGLIGTIAQGVLKVILEQLSSLLKSQDVVFVHTRYTACDDV